MGKHRTVRITQTINRPSTVFAYLQFFENFRHITNIDISPVVIEQMRNKVGSKRPGMVFKQMDALNMTFNNESFTVVLDKGTLDALMPANKEADIQRVKRFFSEIDRVLKMNGR